jgi:hypothetical protein
VELKRPPCDPEFDEFDDDESIIVEEDDRENDDNADGEVSSVTVASPQTDDTRRQERMSNEKISK